MTVRRIRRSRIRSGGFGSLASHHASPDDGSGVVRVNRTYIPSAYLSEPISIDFNMAYNVINPKYLSTCYEKKPIIILHGGPGIPSNYLRPIANHVKDRAVIFYDQIGCGKSNEPSDINAYSIDFAVNDLQRLISHLNLESFHLCGHSFGGIIAFEYIKRQLERSQAVEDTSAVNITTTGSSDSLLPHISPSASSLTTASTATTSTSASTPNALKSSSGCLSLILSSTPFNVHQVDEECKEMIESLANKTGNETSASVSFQKNFVCRTDTVPQPLQEAYENQGRVWQGTEVIQDYVAQAPDMSADTLPNLRLPAILLLRGEFDFVSNHHSIESWKALFQDVSEHHHQSLECQTGTLEGCSHFCMVEDDAQYSQTLMSFLRNHENKKQSGE